MALDLIGSLQEGMATREGYRRASEERETRNRLKELRARHSLTQEQLAKAVSVTRQTIISIERGNYSPSVFLALRIARRLQVPLEGAFWLENDGSPRGARE